MSQKIEIKKDLEDMTTAVAEINETQAGIAALYQKYDKVIFDVDTPDGIAAARAARAEIRTPRYSIENLRKAAKAPVLALGRTLDAMAAELTTDILALETPIDNQIKAEEQRIADAKQAEIDAEAARIQRHKESIAYLYDTVDMIVNNYATAADIAENIAVYKTNVIDEHFEEFAADAKKTWDAGLLRLDAHLATVTAREAENKKIADERAELARLREEDDARRAEKKAEDEALEAKRRKKEDEERAALDKQRADQEAAQEVIDAESKRIADANEALEQKKRDEAARLLAEENAENARQVAAQEAARKAIYPGGEAIVSALSQHFGIPTEVAQQWVAEIKGEQQ